MPARPSAPQGHGGINLQLNRREFVAGSAGIAAGAMGLFDTGIKAGAGSKESTQPTARRYLFLDDVHIDRMEGLKRRGHSAKRFSGNPLFTRKFPWERIRLQLYGRCIVYNSERKILQMFYIAQAATSHYPNLRVGKTTKVGFATLPAYAESRDGIHWERPLRKDVPFEDIAETNLLDINFGQSFEGSVFWDSHDPDPGRRYKAFVWDQRFSLPKSGKLQYRRAAPSLAFPRGLIISNQIIDDLGKVIHEEPYDDYGIMVAFSADGIHWKKHPEWVFRCYSDTGQSVLYEPWSGKYVAYGRFNQQKDSPAFYIGRNVARVESRDFIQWSEPELVLAGDHQDPESFQINSMPVDLYEGIYIGLMEVDVRPLANPSRPIQLATSRDGRHWTRVAGRQPFIENARPGAWDWDDGQADFYGPGTPPRFAHGSARQRKWKWICAACDRALRCG